MGAQVAKYLQNHPGIAVSPDSKFVYAAVADTDGNVVEALAR